MASHGTVEHVRSFDVHTLHRAGALKEELASFPWATFKWPGLVQITANKWRVDVVHQCGASQRISVVWTRCNFGGRRPWFICVSCNRRVGKLYHTGASLACRQCMDLWYTSQRRGTVSRCYLQALKLRLRLNGVASLVAPIPERPRGMHRTTYRRLCRRLEKLERNVRNNRHFMSRETDYTALVPK